MAATPNPVRIVRYVHGELKKPKQHKQEVSLFAGRNFPDKPPTVVTKFRSTSNILTTYGGPDGQRGILMLRTAY